MKKSKIISVVQRCSSQPFVVVGCIIEKDGKFLLIQEGGKWNQPIGWLELRENIIEGAKREVEEETGFQIKIKGLLGVYTLIKQREDKILHTIKFIFTAKLLSQKTKFKKKLKTKWFSIEEIKTIKEQDQLWDPDVLIEVEDYLKGNIYPLEIVSTVTDLSKR